MYHFEFPSCFHLTANAHQGTLSLQFVSLLLRHLLVDSYIRGHHVDKEESCSIIYPPFVRHFLLAKSQELSFDSILNLLKDLLKLCKDTLRSSRGTTLGGKTGMSILVESFPSGSQGNEVVSVHEIYNGLCCVTCTTCICVIVYVNFTYTSCHDHISA